MEREAAAVGQRQALAGALRVGSQEVSVKGDRRLRDKELVAGALKNLWGFKIVQRATGAILDGGRGAA